MGFCSVPGMIDVRRGLSIQFTGKPHKPQVQIQIGSSSNSAPHPAAHNRFLDFKISLIATFRRRRGKSLLSNPAQIRAILLCRSGGTRSASSSLIS
jgi:hypothetical protein